MKKQQRRRHLKILQTPNSANQPPLLIVGLGNPGQAYVQTRHNVGFQVVDALAKRYGFQDFLIKQQGAVSKNRLEGKTVFLFKPLTYMNLSGKAVAPLVHFYKIPLECIWVIHDDLDFPLGKVKLKQGGGNGGHRGLKSLDTSIGKNYGRIRVGIDHPGHPDQVSDYVLKPFKADEMPQVDVVIDALVETFPVLLNCSMERYASDVMQTIKKFI